MHGVAVAIVALLWLVLSAVVSAQPTDPQERAELRTFLEQAINNAESFEDRYDAEVWLVDMSSRLARFVDDPEARLELLHQIHAAAARAELPPELVPNKPRTSNRTMAAPTYQSFKLNVKTRIS